MFQEKHRDENLVYNHLFKGLPPIDVSIDYPGQCELFQICNLALLDEIKRIENENREMNRTANDDLVTDP
tara:strand:+ start:220 stop:429 length:210 start_codon:yes stop_codon:yes gene_type:complete